MSAAPGEISRLLAAIQSGQAEAQDRLLSLVYDELRRLASAYLRKESPGHTLQTTDLVHEAYLRVADQEANWKNRAHFFGIAAQLMRRILVDHARARLAEKRGGTWLQVPLDDPLLRSNDQSQELIDLDEALSRLAEKDERLARVVELRFFGGLTVDETAEILGCDPRTVDRHWRTARARLRQELAPAYELPKRDG